MIQFLTLMNNDRTRKGDFFAVQLEEWMLTTKRRKTLITPEMVKILRIRKTIFIGKMPESEEFSERNCFQSGIVKAVYGTKVVTEEGEFLLGKPSKIYQEFREAVNNAMPTVMNWVIGKNAILSANMYENGKITYLCKKVVEQDFEKHTLRLESGRVVYVVWQNINHQFLQHLANLSQWMPLEELFPTKSCPLQMDVLEATKQIWAFNTVPGKLQPYEWILNSPHNFSILNER